MLMLISRGFGFSALTDHPIWGPIAYQFNHVPWDGIAFWDFVAPAFIFMVGVAMPFAFAHRRAMGATDREIFRHVVWRALMLLLISQIIISIAGGELHFQLNNVLSQIAFAYFFSFLILQMSIRFQVSTVVLLLLGYWALFALFPGSEGPFSRGDNIGSRIDLAVLGKTYPVDDVTITFVTMIATMMLGAWTGLFLLRNRPSRCNLKFIAAGAGSCFLIGFALTPFVPLIQRLWTTSFTLVSAAWALLMLLFFYWWVEIRSHRSFAFPFQVLGKNSIFIYIVSIILYSWLSRAVAIFTGQFKFIGDLAPVAQATTVVLIMWYLCYWLYQRKIFFKV